jgi:hemolysin III
MESSSVAVADAKSHRYEYTLAEEVLNALTHGAGAVLSGAGLTALIIYSAMGADPWRIAGVTIFGVTLLLMYVTSTLYHALPHPRVKDFFRIADHCAIYLLIAGTYTPFLLVTMRGPVGWSLLAFLWTAAAAGCIFKFFYTGRFNKLSTAIYVAMGWTVIVAIKPAIEMVPVGAMAALALGGLLYSVGAIFYLWDRLPFNHAIWHVFVLGGSAAHFFAILYWVAPVA